MTLQPVAGTVDALQAQIHKSSLRVIDVGHPFAEPGHTAAAAGMQGLEYREHLVTDAIAFDALIVVAGVLPDRQLQVLTDCRCFLPREVEQRPHQLGAVVGVGLQQPAAAQAAQSCQIRAAAELHQQCFGPVAGGVSGEHRAAAAGSGRAVP